MAHQDKAVVAGVLGVTKPEEIAQYLLQRTHEEIQEIGLLRRYFAREKSNRNWTILYHYRTLRLVALLRIARYTSS